MEQFNVGQRVENSELGEGTIVKLNEGQLAMVAFSEVETFTLPVDTLRIIDEAEQ